MLFGSDRDRMRSVFVDAWRKRREGTALEPLEAQIAGIVAEHPEYHRLLESPEAVAREFTPEGGESNPFLHLAMHLAILEQVSTDRPPGIRAAYRSGLAGADSAHALDHAVMECLGRSLWEAQRAGRPPDEMAYLECVRRLGAG